VGIVAQNQEIVECKVLVGIGDYLEDNSGNNAKNQGTGMCDVPKKCRRKQWTE
jgi:hypothetical protein